MKRRIIAALMALCLCIGLLPATALAVGRIVNLYNRRLPLISRISALAARG